MLLSFELVTRNSNLPYHNKELLLYLYLFFHLLSQQSNALNSLVSKFFACFKTFSLCVIPSIGTFWLLFPTNQWKTAFIYLVVAPTAYAFSWRRHSFLFQRSCQFVLIFHPCRKVFIGTPYFAATSFFVIPFSKSFRALHFTPIGLLFNLILRASFFSRKEPRMVCLKSRRFVYVFENRMNDSKTLECSNSCQKVRILLKKLGEIWKYLSYREKFIQGIDRFVRSTEMFEFPSIQVIKRSTVLLRMTVTSQFGLRQVIKEPMHILDNSSLCTDLIFMSQANLLIESGVQSSLIQIIITRLV